ncbi:MAG: hypothetical protein QXV57_09905 [Thermoproteota archaeon]
MVKCPFCGFESGLEGFKQLRDPWKYRFYTVRRLECPECKKDFRYYEGISPMGKHSSFTIPRSIELKPGRVKTEHKAGKDLYHDNIVEKLVKLGEMLDFHVSREEPSPDKLYRYDCVWRDAPGHAPLKVFEVEFKGGIDKALARLMHASDLWHPKELYLIVADEKDLERARRLVEPRVSGAFTKIKNELILLSPTDLARIHECLSERGLEEVVRLLFRRGVR